MTESTAGGDRVVLVADDDDGWPFLVSVYFRPRGWKVLTAATEDEFNARMISGRVDVLLLDREWLKGVERPDVRGQDSSFGRMRGDSFLEMVAARWPYVCSIVNTAFPPIDDIAEVLLHGAFQVVDKADGIERLYETCAVGLVCQKLRLVRDQSIGVVSYAETLSILFDEIVPLIRDEHLFPCTEPFEFDIATLLPGGLARFEVSGRTIREFQAPATIRDQMSTVVLQGEKDANSEFSLLDRGSLIVAGFYHRPTLPGMSAHFRHVPQEVAGCVVFHSKGASCFGNKHCHVARQIADVLSDAMLREKVFVAAGMRERRDERDELLFRVARGICDSLQVSQSHLDSAVRVLTDEPAGNVRTVLLNHFSEARISIDECIGTLNGMYRDSSYSAVDVMEVDLLKSLDSAIERISLLFPNTNAIQFERPDGSFEGRLDEREFEDGLVSLLEQSVGAAERRHETDGTDPCVEVAVIRMGSALVIQIADNGDAIPANQLPWVFQQMFVRPTSHPQGSRRISGLWRLREHIESNGGAVAALINAEGRMQFELIIPISAEE